jgi:PAS domain S-box-containing protein
MRRGESRRALEDESRLVRVASKVGRIGGWRVELKDPPLLIWSDEVARIHGLDMEGPPPSWDEMLAFFVQDDQEDVRAAFAMCGQMGVAFTREWRITTQDGRDAWVLSSGEPLRDRDGRITAMEGAYQDITAW